MDPEEILCDEARDLYKSLCEAVMGAIKENKTSEDIEAIVQLFIYHKDPEILSKLEAFLSKQNM